MSAIKPPWAFSMWCDSDNVYVELPAINGSSKHIIRVSNDDEGIRKLLTIAKSRDSESKIGTKGDPNQYQLGRKNFVKARKTSRPSFTQQQRTAATNVLRRLGLI